MSNSSLLKNILALLILGIIAYFSFVIYNQNNQVAPQDNSSEPLFTIDDYNMTRYEDGHPIYNLYGPKMYHYENKKGTIFINPFLSHYVDDDLMIDWTTQSQTAEVTQDKSLLILKDDVTLKSYKNSREHPNVLTTSILYIHDKGESVSNRVFTKLVNYPNNIIEGVGLLGYPKTGEFKLLSNVSSYYENNNEN